MPRNTLKSLDTLVNVAWILNVSIRRLRVAFLTGNAFCYEQGKVRTHTMASSSQTDTGSKTSNASIDVTCLPSEGFPDPLEDRR